MKRYLSRVLFIPVLCVTFACQDKAVMAELEGMKAQAAVEEQNIGIVRQVFQAIDAQDFVRFKELLVPELVVHYSGPQEDLALDAGIQVIKTFYQAFPDYSHSIEDIFAKGDKVAVRMLQQATHQADFQGIPPAGNKISYYQITIMHVKDGKVHAWWIVEDNLGMMTQLGMELKPIQEEKK